MSLEEMPVRFTPNGAVQIPKGYRITSGGEPGAFYARRVKLGGDCWTPCTGENVNWSPDFVYIVPFENVSVDPEKTLSHPSYYGGDNTYEAIKVIEAWGLGFHLGNVVKYICRAGKKDTNRLKDLKKAADYLNREIHLEEQKCKAQESA
jgi:Protein of unknwon function (DUF3310)